MATEEEGMSHESTIPDVLTVTPSEQDASADAFHSITDAEILEPSLPSRLWHFLAAVVEQLVGLASVIVGLAVLASVPIFQFLSLGYLLEASRRVAVTGRLRNGCIGFAWAARLGGLILGTWLMLLPLRYLSDLWYSSYLIDPRSDVTARYRLGLWIATIAMVSHIFLAWYSGGRLRHFFWPILAPFLFGMWLLRHVVASRFLRPLVRPVVGTLSPRLMAEMTYVPPLSSWFPPAIFWAGLRSGRLYSEARDAVWEFFQQLQIRYYFFLGFRGFAGALLWLLVPGVLLISALRLPPGLGFLSGVLGAIALGWVLIYLPFLQTRFATQNRFKAMFELRPIRQMFKRAPIAFWFALLSTLLFAIPLYLLKIETTPREVAWLSNLFFVLFIYPARLLTGWAMSRAAKRQTPRLWLWRWAARLAAIPVIGFYVLIVFFAQFTSWHGALSLFEQHAFLLPVPFFGV